MDGVDVSVRWGEGFKSRLGFVTIGMEGGQGLVTLMADSN